MKVNGRPRSFGPARFSLILTLKTQLQKYQEAEKQLYAAKRRVDEQQGEINELCNLQVNEDTAAVQFNILRPHPHRGGGEGQM